MASLKGAKGSEIIYVCHYLIKHFTHTNNDTRRRNNAGYHSCGKNFTDRNLTQLEFNCKPLGKNLRETSPTWFFLY